ncbi:MAG: hypothetical protein ACI8S6_000980 [Myxococcota bacterium]|jgi:hypothetical protein
MAAELTPEDPRPLTDVLQEPEARLSRALNAYNMVLSLDLGEQRRAMLQGVFARADEAVPDDITADRMLASGAAADLREIPGYDGEGLRAVVEAFGRDDLGVVIQTLLASLTGHAAAVPEVVPPPMPHVELKPAAAAVIIEGWEAIFCAYDVARRRHRLTLLRCGAWVEGPVLPDGAEDGEADADAERLLGPLLDAAVDPAAVDTLIAQTRAFETPSCPGQDALIAQLVEEHGPFEQLYLLQIRHRLPNPAQVSHQFEVREAGAHGRLQRLSRSYGYRPAGLGVEGVKTELSTRWDSPAHIEQRGRPQPYPLPLLQPGPLAALAMASGWQLRSDWRLTLTPLIEGPTFAAEVQPTLSGGLQLNALGHLQERFSLSSAQFAATYEGDRCIAHSGEEVPGAVRWAAGASIGAGDLTVLSENSDVSLGGSGESLSRELRPVPNVVPRMEHTHRWQAEAGTSQHVGAIDLCGASVIEQTARTADALAEAQATAAASAAAEVRAGAVVKLGVHQLDILLSDTPGPGGPQAPDGASSALWDHPGAGTIKIDGQPRWRLRWQVREQEEALDWTTPVDLVSGSEWGTSTEQVRDPVEARHRVSARRIAAAYWLVPASPEDFEE